MLNNSLTNVSSTITEFIALIQRLGICWARNYKKVEVITYALKCLLYCQEEVNQIYRDTVENDKSSIKELLIS